MAGTDSIVIVGGGHAGAQLCAGLVAAGLGSRVHLVCEEPELPYHRPPLSKSYLKNSTEGLQWHRASTWFDENGVTVHAGDAAVAIDRTSRTLELRSGVRLAYGQLVLATGTRARCLPALPEGLRNVAVLRTAQDAARLRERLEAASALTVIGAGFIGLEVAATARTLGKAVQVLESAPRLLMRSVSPELAAHVLDTHQAAGIAVRLGVQVGNFDVVGEQLVALTVDGVRQPVDLLLLGIGAEPECTLARDSGLACDNGVLVDEALRTSDRHILAMGDCASFPDVFSGRRLRLESVQNANDHAKTAVVTLTGAAASHRAVPWFWSEQGTLRLQMAGLMPLEAERHRRPGATAGSFSWLHYAQGRLACVESVNAPADHLAARKLLESGASPEPAQACEPGRPLKDFLRP